ncbi:MAG: serine protease [Thermoproteota archaeon]
MWAGAYYTPGHIITCAHAFSASGKEVVREPQINIKDVQIVNINGDLVEFSNVSFPRTGDIAVVTCRQNWDAWIPLGKASYVPYGDLVYMWGYPLSYEGYSRQNISYAPGRWPYWGIWVLGWWEGPASPSGELFVEGRDFRVLCPSSRGQSGSPCVWLRAGTDPVIVGVLSLTQSVSIGSFMESSYSYITAAEHIQGGIYTPTFSETLLSAWQRAKPYAVPALLGIAAGSIIAGTRR